MYIICGDMWRYVEILRESDDQLSGCDRMVCYLSGFTCRNGTAPRWYSGWLVLLVGDSPQKNGWLVVSSPLKNMSQWEGLSHIYN